MYSMSFIGLALMIAAPMEGTPPAESFAWRVNDEAAPADPSQATQGGFGIQMFLTADYDGFWRAWEGPTPPQLSVTDRIERGKPVHGMLVFSGCKAAADGNCNLTAVYTITGPDGTAYGEPRAGNVWAGPPAPAYNLQLSEGSIGLVVEPGEPLGRYTLQASVTDHVAGITLTVKAPVDAVEVAANSAR